MSKKKNGANKKPKIINRKKDDYLFYKYQIHEIYILFKGETYKIRPERLNSFTVIHDFEENLYPIIKCDIGIEHSLYKKIMKHKNDLKIKLCIRKFYRKNTQKKKSLAKNHINELFTLILDDLDDSLTDKAHKKEYPHGDKDELHAATINLELFLFKKTNIVSNTSHVNTIFKDASVSGAVGYLLGKSGAKNILMPTPDNQNIYPELLIPPMDIVNALYFIDSYYGIYNTGTMFYFSFDRGYILPFCRPSKALSSGESETVCVILPDIGSKITDNICSLKKYSDSKTPYVIADPNSFKPTSKSVSQAVLSPESIDLVDNATGEVDSAKGKNRISVISRSENKFYKQIYNAMIDSNKTVITVNLKDCDFSLFTPNKKYKFIFEDTKKTKEYKGTYFLSSISTTYVKEAKAWTGEAEAVFRKML